MLEDEKDENRMIDHENNDRIEIYRIIGDGRSGVEDTITPTNGLPQALEIKKIRSAEPQPLLRPLEFSQMGILRII